ncbi:hypothetical protein [Pyxidicoccus caerfyrddinensis]|uniref:hypothetical protein n=1 Tax=Pyxidicoccus caerfyrddinensis TaxID=2709663 RepID=UPI0013DBB444|nr:hypothetical protein [Pyxidicoccus caerfyrddinensis]
MTRQRPSRSWLWGAAILGLLVLAPMAMYLLLKQEAGRNAKLLSEDWNAAHTCAVSTYAPYLEGNSVRSRLFYLFSASTFFRVHDARGQPLKSTEWRLWEREFGDQEAPKWIHDGSLVYPTTDGYAHWELPECAPP